MYFMLQSLIKQKWALGVFESEYELHNNLTAHQWRPSKVAPFEELTRKVSSSDVLASDVMPVGTILQRLLSKVTDKDGIKTVKGTLAAVVKRQFTDTGKKTLFCSATVLDPR